MKLTPTARCAMRASPRPGGAVSSSVHSHISGPPAVRTMIPKSVAGIAPLPRQSSGIAADAYHAFVQCLLIRRKTQAHEAARLSAKSASINHRYVLRSIQPMHEFISREARSTHIDQREHAGVRNGAMYSRRAIESRQQHIAPAAAKLANPRFRRAGFLQRRDGRLLYEARQAEQHAHRQ